MHELKYSPDQKVHLIDTPGFNDTSRSDVEIFKEIAFILGAIRKANVKVAGIIYLHRISEPRITGSSLKTMRIFEALCGRRCFPNVVIVSTMWEGLSPEQYLIAEEREKTLKEKEDFWGRMIKGGATITRHHGNASSARDILSRAAATRGSLLMSIQQELIDEKRTLDETSAGQLLLDEFRKTRVRQKQEIAELEEIMAEAAKIHDDEIVLTIIAEKEDHERRMRDIHLQKEDLEIGFDELAEERAAHHDDLFQDKSDHESDNGNYLRQIEDLENTLHMREEAFNRDKTRLARDNKLLKMRAEKHDIERRRLEHEIEEMRLNAESAQKTAKGHKQGGKLWGKVLQIVLPTQELREKATYIRSVSRSKSRQISHRSTSMTKRQLREQRTDQESGWVGPEAELNLARHETSDSSSDTKHKSGRSATFHNDSRHSHSEPREHFARQKSDPSLVSQQVPVIAARTATERRKTTIEYCPPPSVRVNISSSNYTIRTPTSGPPRKYSEETNLARRYQ